MPITHEDYDQLKVDRLQYFLEDMATKGQAKFFEVFVDSLKVVPKTDDPKELQKFDYYLNEDTEKIRIIIYNSGLSPRNDQYCFYLQKGKTEKGLNGLGNIEEIIQEKLQIREKELELKQLQENYANAEQELEEAEKEIEDLKKQLAEALSNKHKIGNLDLVAMGSAILERVATKNSGLLNGLGLGDITTKDSKPSLQNEPEGDNSFSKKPPHPTITEDEDLAPYIATIRTLETHFDATQMEQVIGILQYLMNDPSQLSIILSLLTPKTTS
jgi:hypothetical protein